MVRAVFAALFALLAAAPAAGEEKIAPGSSVEMPYLIAPVIVNDRLTAYAYVSSKIVATSPANAIEVRAKLAFIQDAFVRDVNARPIGKPDDPATVDTESLKARLLADAKRIVGAAKVLTIEFVTIQMSPMHEGSPS
ncbi:MAG: hypothetical protein HY243_01450 [Proteobacteria bacterium]|nr:hypothetical protein [Pseudomonadota bacterium]